MPKIKTKKEFALTQRTNGILTACNFERNFRGYMLRIGLNKNITPHSFRLQL